MDYQDVLAKVGAGTAHPGGFAATKQWMASLHCTKENHVLEVGCGTGRTLTSLVHRFECRATGIDVRTEMIEKARTRSRDMGVHIDWIVASAEQLPIESESIDLVVTESVNVFVKDVDAALREYQRVLRPGGRYIDVEMFLRAPVDSAWKKSAGLVYGVLRVPDQRGWKRLFQKAGFDTVQVLSSQGIEPGAMIGDDEGNVDIVTPNAYQDPEVIRMLQANMTWMEQNYHVLGFATYQCVKAGA